MIYVTGDIHGEVFRVAEAVDRFKITAEDVIVILGDVGMNYFGNNHGDRHRKKKLNKLGVPIFCIKDEEVLLYGIFTGQFQTTLAGTNREA